MQAVRAGGLYTCCIRTVYNLRPDFTPQEEGTLQCQYTTDLTHNMIFRDGAWEWNTLAAFAEESKNSFRPGYRA